MSEKHYTVSVIVPKELYDIVRARASFNQRSISGETRVLIEAGLADDNEQLSNLFRLAAMMNELPK